MQARTTRARVASGVATLFAYLPLRANRAIGACIGWMAWALRTRSRRFAEVNVALAFDELSSAQQAALVRRSLVNNGISLTESLWVWRRPAREIFSRMINDEVAAAIDATRQRGTGTLLATPHIGNWEATLQSVCGLATNGEPLRVAYFYRPPRNPDFEPITIEGRTSLGGDPLRLDAGGIRLGIKRLRAGGIVGILPDQEPDRDGGVFVPFFGEPALTMTLMSRLAQKTRATVLFVVAERTPTGWRNHAITPSDAIYAPDPIVSANAVNEAVERCIRIAPEQYLWSYRRYRELPEGGRRSY